MAGQRWHNQLEHQIAAGALQRVRQGSQRRELALARGRVNVRVVADEHLRAVRREALEMRARIIAVLEGDELILVVAGSRTSATDRELPALLRGAIPAGTPVVVNRIPGTRHDVGDVPG